MVRSQNNLSAKELFSISLKAGFWVGLLAGYSLGFFVTHHLNSFVSLSFTPFKQLSFIILCSFLLGTVFLLIGYLPAALLMVSGQVFRHQISLTSSERMVWSFTTGFFATLVLPFYLFHRIYHFVNLKMFASFGDPDRLLFAVVILLVTGLLSFGIAFFVWFLLSVPSRIERLKKRGHLAVFLLMACLWGMTAVSDIHAFYSEGFQGRRAIPPDSQRKIILIGIDGATWDVISPLLAEGNLRNLAKLKHEGTSGILYVPEDTPTLSPIVWTTIATGRHWSQHGIDTWEKGFNSTMKKQSPFGMS